MMVATCIEETLVTKEHDGGKQYNNGYIEENVSVKAYNIVKNRLMSKQDKMKIRPYYIPEDRIKKWHRQGKLENTQRKGRKWCHLSSLAVTLIPSNLLSLFRYL